MEKIKILILIFFLVLGAGLIFYPNWSQAKTVVTCEGCDITITVYLAFAFLDDVSWMNAQQLVNEWVNGMLEIWNEPDFTYGFCECPVHFEVVVEILPKGKDCTHAKQNMPGWHCVNVINEPVNQRGNVADAHKIPPNDGDGFGEWSTTATGLNVAHEVGHLMGLGEEYHRDANGNWVNDNPQAGNAQSIMAKTWGEVKALPEHIDKIVEDAGVECPLPKCCCGNGEHEDYIGEKCDYTADPSGCPAGQVCDNTCKCVSKPKVTPICGDGYISRPPDGKEECDPKAKPTGCKPNEECVGCKCQKKEVLPAPPETPTPLILVTPDSLDFGSTATENFFVISNTGEGTLSWEISPDFPGWLSALPIQGETLAGEESTVLVNVDRTGMLPGTYEHKISVTSNGGESSVSVKMLLEEGL